MTLAAQQGQCTNTRDMAATESHPHEHFGHVIRLAFLAGRVTTGNSSVIVIMSVYRIARYLSTAAHPSYMKRKPRYLVAAKSYSPSIPVSSLIKEMLRFENKARTRRNAGGGNRAKDMELDRERKSLNRRKVEVLNKHIFPAMANLTVLLEHMLKSPYIHGVFQDDLKSLFFTQYTDEKKNPPTFKPPVFVRFTQASCKLVMDKPTEDGKMSKLLFPDFRLILCDMMLESVYRAILEIAPFKYGDLDFLQKTLYADMDRAHSWTTMLAKEPLKSLKFDKDRRPALF